MTFSVLSVTGNRETVIGTIWADAESEAQSIASNLCAAEDQRQVVVRKSEERELPLRLPN